MQKRIKFGLYARQPIIREHFADPRLAASRPATFAVLRFFRPPRSFDLACHGKRVDAQVNPQLRPISRVCAQRGNIAPIENVAEVAASQSH